MNSKFLKYGDTITLYSEQTKGFLTSMGFNNPDLFVQSDPHSDKAFIPNQRNMVFKVVPRLTYDAAKDYRKLNEHILASKKQELKEEAAGEDEEQKGGATNERHLEQVLITSKLSLLKLRMKHEKDHNQRLISNRSGMPVFYGNEI